MNQQNYYHDIPQAAAGFRILPGLAVQVWDENANVTVRLSPRLALTFAQQLIFDAREALDAAERTFNATEDRARAERIAAEAK